MPGGIREISQGLSEARAIPLVHATKDCIPAGMPDPCALASLPGCVPFFRPFRGCRSSLAQPLANGCDASGIRNQALRLVPHSILICAESLHAPITPFSPTVRTRTQTMVPASSARPPWNIPLRCQSASTFGAPVFVCQKTPFASPDPLVLSSNRLVLSSKGLVFFPKGLVLFQEPLVLFSKPLVLFQKRLVLFPKPLVPCSKGPVLFPKPPVLFPKGLVLSSKSLVLSPKRLVPSAIPPVFSGIASIIERIAFIAGGNRFPGECQKWAKFGKQKFPRKLTHPLPY